MNTSLPNQIEAEIEAANKAHLAATATAREATSAATRISDNIEPTVLAKERRLAELRATAGADRAKAESDIAATERVLATAKASVAEVELQAERLTASADAADEREAVAAADIVSSNAQLAKIRAERSEYLDSHTARMAAGLARLDSARSEAEAAEKNVAEQEAKRRAAESDRVAAESRLRDASANKVRSQTTFALHLYY